MAENDGGIAIGIRLALEELKQQTAGVQATLDKMAAQFKAKGEEAGKVYTKEVGKGFKGLIASIKNGLNSAGKESDKFANKLGKMLAPSLLALGAGIKIISGIGGAIANSFNANEKFVKSVEELKSSLGASFAAAAKPVGNFFSEIIQKAADSIKQSNALRESLKRLKEGTADYGSSTSQRLKTVTADYNAQKKEIEELTNKIKQAVEAGNTGGAGLETLKKELDI
jgi:hypothetical protein